MGTNYYWQQKSNPCPTCGQDPAETIHIGKSSGGWTFSFHGTETIRSWRDWQAELSGDGQIYDEYGCKLSLEDFRKVVEERSRPDGLRNHYDYCAVHHPQIISSGSGWKDPEGHSFSTGEFR